METHINTHTGSQVSWKTNGFPLKEREPKTNGDGSKEGTQ